MYEKQLGRVKIQTIGIQRKCMFYEKLLEHFVRSFFFLLKQFAMMAVVVVVLEMLTQPRSAAIKHNFIKCNSLFFLFSALLFGCFMCRSDSQKTNRLLFAINLIHFMRIKLSNTFEYSVFLNGCHKFIGFGWT